MIFEDAVKLILKHEGGYVFDEADPGGETNFGISKASYPHLDIKELTIEQAIEIYKNDFWDKYQVESLPALLRLTFFDCCVNQGPTWTIKSLQLMLMVEDDGVLGPKTISAMSSFRPIDIFEVFTMKRFNRYSKNSNWSRYGIGWFKRLIDITVRSFDGLF